MIIVAYTKQNIYFLFSLYLTVITFLLHFETFDLKFQFTNLCFHRCYLRFSL